MKDAKNPAVPPVETTDELRASSVEGKTGFLILLHAHDYVWFSDWPAEVTREALKILWTPVCRGEV